MNIDCHTLVATTNPYFSPSALLQLLKFNKGNFILGKMVKQVNNYSIAVGKIKIA